MPVMVDRIGLKPIKLGSCKEPLGTHAHSPLLVQLRGTDPTIFHL